MKEMMVEYRDVISFDLTYNMVKQWKLGCFVAMSSAKHFAPLGLVMTLYERK